MLLRTKKYWYGTKKVFRTVYRSLRSLPIELPGAPADSFQHTKISEQQRIPASEGALCVEHDVCFFRRTKKRIYFCVRLRSISTSEEPFILISQLLCHATEGVISFFPIMRAFVGYSDVAPALQLALARKVDGLCSTAASKPTRNSGPAPCRIEVPKIRQLLCFGCSAPGDDTENLSR